MVLFFSIYHRTTSYWTMIVFDDCYMINTYTIIKYLQIFS